MRQLPSRDGRDGAIAPVVIAAAGAVAAVAARATPWQTEGRLLVAALLPLSLCALARRFSRDRASEVLLGLAILYVLVAWAHVVTTSRAAAWVLDSHMAPWVPMPGPTARLGLAWLTTLGWLGLLALAAVLLRRARANVIAQTCLLGAAVLPLFASQAFATDPYALVMRPSAFVDLTYTAAAALIVPATLLAPRGSPRGEPSESS